MSGNTSIGAAMREITRQRRAELATAAPTGPSIVERVLRRRRREPPLRRIDALLRVPLFGPRNGSFRTIAVGTEREPGLGPGPVTIERPGRAAARGWQALERRFTELGYTIVPVPDGRVTLASPKGRAEGIELLDVFARVAPLIAAGRAGKPLRCAWCKAEAVTLLAGNVEACAEHAA